MTNDMRTTQRLTAVSYDEPVSKPAAPVVAWRSGEYTHESLSHMRKKGPAYNPEAITRVDIPAIQD